MINPLSRISFTHSTRQIEIGTRPPLPSTQDSLQGANKNIFSVIRKFVADWFFSVWSWVRTHFISLFIDVKESENNKLKESLDRYIDLYCTHSIAKTEQDRKTIVKAFSKLDPELKKLIKSEIIAILKQAYPGKNQKLYELQVNRYIDNPYKDLTKKIDDVQGHVLIAALLNAKSKLNLKE